MKHSRWELLLLLFHGRIKLGLEISTPLFPIEAMSSLALTSSCTNDIVPAQDVRIVQAHGVIGLRKISL